MFLTGYRIRAVPMAPHTTIDCLADSWSIERACVRARQFIVGRVKMNVQTPNPEKGLTTQQEHTTAAVLASARPTSVRAPGVSVVLPRVGWVGRWLPLVVRERRDRFRSYTALIHVVLKVEESHKTFRILSFLSKRGKKAKRAGALRPSAPFHLPGNRFFE